MTHAIVVHQTGGPEVLKFEPVKIAQPHAGEVLLRHTAIGLNFIDIYFRSGLYPSPKGLPFIPGNEGAGIVEVVAPDVRHIKPGDRVAYVGPLGGYSEQRVIPAERLVVLPDGISDKIAASSMLKGMTAHYLLHRTYQIKKGDVVLIHAAAGGVGLIVCQWASALGATVIGTVGTEEKARQAKSAGAHYVINYRTDSFVEAVQEITKGKGVDVVYDSVGQDTYPGSLDCLKPFGLWVSFGQSSGPIANFNLADLSQKGSLYATRPTLFNYIAKRTDLELTAQGLFGAIHDGLVKVDIHKEFFLKQAAEAHAELESRQTMGACILIPTY